MKPENTKQSKWKLTDKDRDQVLKLMTCGLPTKEIADIMHISTSTVCYIRQAHTACINKDWSTLQRLSLDSRPTVDWAMRVTGTDKVFEETFPKEPEPEVETPKTEPATVVEPAITREDFLQLSNTLQDIVYLLTEIRDTLK